MLTYTGLIARILEAMGIDESNPKHTPADKVPIGKYLEGAQFCKE